jgi:phosphohistidine phosphatase
MQLYILRHGHAAARADLTADDADRPLTEEGKALMAHEAATLRRLAVKPDLIITSPLTRARQTAEIIAAGLDAEERVIDDARVGEGFGAKRLRRMLAEHDDAGSIMVVGHEPDLSVVIRKLTGAHVVCGKGSLARIDLPDMAAAQGTLVWLLQGDVLAAGAVAAPSATAGAAKRREEPEAGQATSVAPSGERAPLLQEPGKPAPRGRRPDAGKVA